MSFRLCSACKHEYSCTYPRRETLTQCEEYELACFSEINPPSEHVDSTRNPRRMTAASTIGSEVAHAARA